MNQSAFLAKKPGCQGGKTGFPSADEPLIAAAGSDPGKSRQPRLPTRFNQRRERVFLAPSSNFAARRFYGGNRQA